MPTPHRIFKTVAEVSWCVASFIPMPCSALRLSIFYGLPAFRLPTKVLAPARFNWAAHFESSRAADLTWVLAPRRLSSTSRIHSASHTPEEYARQVVYLYQHKHQLLVTKSRAHRVNFVL